MFSKKVLFILIVIFQLFTTAYSHATIYACGDNSLATDSYPKHKRNDKIYLCIHFHPFDVKVAFEVKVDEYIVLQVTKSFELFQHKVNSANIVAQLAGEKMFSTQSPYMNAAQEKVFWLQQLIISLNGGKLSSYYWDNNCAGCTDKCEEQYTTSTDYLGEAYEYKKKNCYVSYCKLTSDTTYYCDLRIMVMWSGTDKNDDNLTSSTYRISNFVNQSSHTMYDAYKKGQLADSEASTTIANSDAKEHFNSVA